MKPRFHHTKTQHLGGRVYQRQKCGVLRSLPMRKPQPDERTSLSAPTSRYHAAEARGPAAETPAASGGILARIALSAGAIFVVMFVISVLLPSAAVPSSTDPSGSPGAQSGTYAGSPDKTDIASSPAHIPETDIRVIPSMQPFSTTDPADAHCPHMDRPRETWPTTAWGALANASVDLHTSLPTNAWWENIALGSPTQVCGKDLRHSVGAT